MTDKQFELKTITLTVPILDVIDCPSRDEWTQWLTDRAGVPNNQGIIWSVVGVKSPGDLLVSVSWRPFE